MWKLSSELKVKNIPYIFKNRHNRELIFLATPNNDRISKYRREKKNPYNRIKADFHVCDSIPSVLKSRTLCCKNHTTCTCLIKKEKKKLVSRS